MTWIIVRTDFRKEFFVAARIRALGYDAWVPAQMIATRPAIARRVTSKALPLVKELPLLPKRLFVRMDYPAASVFVGIRHFEEVERDGEERIVTIPDSQIKAFQDAIARENAAAMALVVAKNRKQKARWRSLKDALMDLVDLARQQMEEAA